MFAEYLTRGVKAGVVAGLVFGLFMAIVANPLVVYADEMNHASVEAGHHHELDHSTEAGHDHTVVSLAATKLVSVLSSGLWAVLLGGVFFGVVYYVAEPMIPGTGASKSYLLGGAGFITVSGAPWLVVPPVAPGAEQSLPVDTRLLLYGGMMVAGALTCVLGGVVYNRLEASSGRLVAAVGAVVPLGLLAIPAVLAPTNTVQGALPADLRAGMVGLFVFGQVLVWMVLAATHARFQSTDESDADRSVRTDSAVTAD